jgi:hypothetical protein
MDRRKAMLFFCAAITAFSLHAGCNGEIQSDVQADGVSCPRASLRRFDAAKRCFEAPQVVSGVCRRSDSAEKAQSIGILCAFDPDGDIWVTMLRVTKI